MKGYIYKIENLVNGKKYVGLTKDLVRRRNSHLSQARTGSKKSLYRDMRKYGVDNFVLKKIITIEEQTEEKLYEKLIYFRRRMY